MAGLAAGVDAHATALHFCERRPEVNATDQDHRLRFAARVRQALDDTPGGVALIARSGLDLARFDIRYSHAGIALRADGGAWSVRQLYYACDESRSRLFDEGVAGFLLGMDDPRRGHVTVVHLPAPLASRLRDTALDKPRALAFLHADYSANAYPFSTRYQNCNQWVAELLAAAWAPEGSVHTRDEAQAWLRAQGYAPARITLDSRLLLLAGAFVPLLHVRDHPGSDVEALQLQVSLPVAIEAFVHQQAPEAARTELCHDDQKIVVRRGWIPLGDGCEAAPGDEVIPLLGT
ncbi:hypothetical protein CPZ87_07275 [Piscinibacter gummiphilus]|nr:hypothetical protein CPZ87_07275 [Piscinibacter gummiphilus]